MAVDYNNYTMEVTTDPEAGFMELSDKQWQLYLDKYKPLEDAVFSQLQDDKAIETAAQDSEQAVQDSYAATAGMTDRRLSRYGAKADSLEQSSIDRNRKLSEALSTAKAGNSTRAGMIDQNIEILGQATGIGKDVAATSSQGLASAASMADAREQAYQQQKSAYKANQMNTVMSGAGLGAALGSAGVFGATVGAGMGAAIGGGAGLLLAMI